MEGDRAAFALVRHLNLEAEEIAELSLEREQVGVRLLCRISSARARNAAWSGIPFAARPFLRLTDRQTLGDDEPRQFRRIRSCGYSPCMTHTDIAFQ